jgi:hypothetical protein
MTSDQRIALSIFVLLLVVGGGVFLFATGTGGGDDGVGCSSGEVQGAPIKEGQSPDPRACEAMGFAVRFFEAPADECPDFVSAELVGECGSKAEIEPSEWSYVGDSGIDPSTPDELCVELAYENGYRTVGVEEVDDALQVVDSDC